MYLPHIDSHGPARGSAIPARRGQRIAAALVEFAVVAPLMFVLMLATFEFGRTFMVMELLTEGARVGCRQAVVEGTSSQQIQNTVTSYLTGVGINGDTVRVIVNDTPGLEAATQPAYAEMTVKVTVPVSSVSWVPNPLFTSGNLSGQFTMRRE